MKAILINPKTMEVNRIEIESGVSSIQKTIGCRVFQQGPMPGIVRNVAYVDEEGTWTQKHGVRFIDGTYLLGNVLIVGDDGEGGDCDCTLTTLQVAKLIKNPVTNNEVD